MKNDTVCRKENRRVKYTKSVLKDSLLHFLLEKPLREISITELCNFADVNRGTFYNYYKDVDNLLDSIESDFIENLFSVAKDLNVADVFFNISFASDNNHAPLDRNSICTFIEGILNYLRTEREVCKLLLTGDCGRNFINRISDSITAYYVVNWRMYVDASARANEEDYLSMLFRYVTIGIIELIIDWIRDDMRIPPKEYAELIVRVAGTEIFGIQP